MLHKGKLHAALQLKKGQFGLYDGTFSEQLSEYRTALETLHSRFPSSTHMERVLPPEETNMAAGARPTIEFDRWLASDEQRTDGLKLSLQAFPLFLLGVNSPITNRHARGRNVSRGLRRWRLTAASCNRGAMPLFRWPLYRSVSSPIPICAACPTQKMCV